MRRYYLVPSATEAQLKQALTKGFFKKKAATPRFERSRLIFCPYWWVKGMVFKWIFGKRTVPSLSGEMPERLNGPVSKTGVGATLPGVQIPLSPPLFLL